MMRILVIENDPSQRQLFKTALENTRYEVSDASDGKEGFQIFHQQSCDLIITDIKHFGADRTLKKPIKIQRLLAMVDELLNVKGRLHPS